MSFARFDDVDLYYEVHGNGPPLVFIHGASGTHLAWWQQVAELRHRWTCLIYDLRGFGKSVARDYNPSDGAALVRDLDRLIAHVGMQGERINIVGNSLGSMPALGYAADHADGVAKLVLSSGFGGLRSPELDAGWKKRIADFDAVAAAAIEESGLVAHAGPLPHSPDERTRFANVYRPFGAMGATLPAKQPALAFLYAELAVMAAGPPISLLHAAFLEGRPVDAREAKTLPFPVRLFSGSEDRIFPTSDMERAATLFKDGRCKVFHDIGHAIYYEEPQKFNAALTAFLEE